MGLNMEIRKFVDGWLLKADQHNGNNVSDYYDKAFTLFTVYNRLYAEATFTLARQGRINLNSDKHFPDSKGAVKYAPMFIGHKDLLTELNADSFCRNSINEIVKLIEEEKFYIKLSMPYGRRQREKDIELLNRLKSNGAKTKITAILDLIYSIRCNMFHGNKRFEPIQVKILNPVTIILRKIIDILYSKLKQQVEY